MKKLITLFIFLPLFSNAQIINTIAGNGSLGYSGDGSAATAAAISDPSGLAFDNSGNIYIGGYGNSTIRIVTPSGIISTIAGTGVAGFSGDGGQATAAQINRPVKITRDAAGNLFFADEQNNRIRKISTTGVITTIAGNGTPTFSGDGGPATAAGLFHPSAVILDGSGNLYIADHENNRVRMINTSGTITTIAGNGSGGYSGDGGMATAAGLYWPFGLTFDGSGNLYIGDQKNNRVRKVSPTGIISTFAGTGVAGAAGDGGAATAAQLSNPSAIAIDNSGNFYIADQVNNKVRRVSASGIITTFAGTGVAGFSGDGGPATAAQFDHLNEIAFDTSWRLVICDNTNHRVRRISVCPNYITSQPVHDTVDEGTNAVYTVITTMPSPLYQWQEDPGTGFVDLANVWPYSGVTTNSLTIHNASHFLNATHYRCVISNGSTCSDTSNAAILIIHPSAGITSVNLSSVGIYPNPAHDDVTIRLPTGIYTADIQIINELGQVAADQKTSNGIAIVNVAGMPVGMYIIRIQAGTSVTYNKVFRQ